MTDVPHPAQPSDEIAAYWSSRPMVGFDLETTGTSVEDDRAVTASLVYVAPGEEPTICEWIIDPGIPIPDEAAAVHGWSTERVLADPRTTTPDVALPQIADQLANLHERRIPVVIYNAQYDLTLLDRELGRHGIPALEPRASHGRGCAPIIDLRVLDKHVDPYRKNVCDCGCGATNRTLSGVCQHYGVDLHPELAHTSAADALAAVQLVPALIGRYAQRFRGYTVEGLHDAQVVWWRASQRSFAHWNRTKNGGAYTDIREEWPMIPRSVPVAPGPDTEQGALL